MFHKDKKSKDNHSSVCKDCMKKYYEENKEKIKEQARTYKREHKEQAKLATRRWAIKNKEEIAKRKKEWDKENKDKVQRTAKLWYYNNKDKFKEYMKKRKEKEAQLFNDFTEEQWNKIKIEFDNKCCYCGNEDVLERDHFIPVSKDGHYTYKNIVPACKSCNSSKGTKDFLEWYITQDFFDEERLNKILEHIN